MEKPNLSSFGITPTEEKVYFEILKLGETKIGEIIRRTGLHRGTVYNSINQLAEKGFISFIDKEGIRSYRISGKKIFEELVLESKKKAESSFIEIEKLFKDLSENGFDKTKHRVETFLGTNSFKTCFIEMLDVCRENNIEYLFQGNGSEVVEALGDSFYNYIKKLREGFGIKARLIFEERFRDPKLIEDKNLTIKYTVDKIKTPLNLWIYKDITLIVFFDMNPITIIRIKNESLASRFRNYFEELWGQPVMFENRKIYRENLVDLTEGVETMNIVCKDDIAPFFMYPHRINKFIEYREIIKGKRKTLTGNQDVDIFKAYLRLWKSKARVRYVVGERSILGFLKIIKENYGKKELKRYLEELKKNLKKYNVEIRVLKDFNPITMYTSEKGFMVVFPSLTEVYGFITSGGGGVKGTFNKLFEDYWNKSSILEPYLTI